MNASVLKNKLGKDAVLCMDGGGIRGLVLTELLFSLEETTGHQIADLFDWVSGTSTGSYLALALAAGILLGHSFVKFSLFNFLKPSSLHHYNRFRLLLTNTA